MRGIKRLTSLTIAVVIPLIASAQSSQSMRDRDPDLDGSKRLAAELQQANFHSGSFYLMSRIRISDAGYSETASLPTGDSSGGLSLSIDAPQRLYYVPHKKTIFTLEITPGFSFFESQDGGRETQFNYLGRADAHFLFNHLYLDVYALREDRLRAHVADINRLVTARSDETGVVGEIKYSSKTSALFNLRLRDTEFPADRFQPTDVPLSLLERREKNGRLSLHHKTFALTSLFVAGERSDYDFDQAGLFTNRNSTRTWYGAGALYSSGRSVVRLETGPVRLDFDDPAQEDYSGINASVTLSRASGRRTYTVGADRDLGFSVTLRNNYFISNTLRAAVTHSATRRLSFRLNGILERDDFDVPVNGVDRQDTISFTGVGFAYALRKLTFGADVGWYERSSTIGLEEDSGIRTFLHLSFTP